MRVEDAAGERHLRPGELSVERHDDVLVGLALLDGLDLLVSVRGVGLIALVVRTVGLPRGFERGPVDRRTVVPNGLLIDRSVDHRVLALVVDLPRLEVVRVGLDGSIRVHQEELRRVPRGKACGVSAAVSVERVHLRRDLVDPEPHLAALLQILSGLRIVVRLLDLGRALFFVGASAIVARRTAAHDECEGSTDGDDAHQLLVPFHGTPLLPFGSFRDDGRIYPVNDLSQEFRRQASNCSVTVIGSGTH